MPTFSSEENKHEKGSPTKLQSTVISGAGNTQQVFFEKRNKSRGIVPL